MTVAFERSVFINCPFDEDYAPVLQAIAFCVTYLGFYPRLAPEDADNARTRLDRIAEIVESSKYGIHDLSRCKSHSVGEYARMNMPFELGMDHACRRFGNPIHRSKSLLVLECDRYDYQKTLSDIAGWDIEAHNGDREAAVRRVRGWLVAKAGAERVGPAKIQGAYLQFQEWYYERELASGASDTDIQEYPTVEIVAAMAEWMSLGQPY